MLRTIGKQSGESVESVMKKISLHYSRTIYRRSPAFRGLIPPGDLPEGRLSFPAPRRKPFLNPGIAPRLGGVRSLSGKPSQSLAEACSSRMVS